MAENSKPTTRPKRKITVGILGGSIIVVLVWALKTFANVQVTSEVAAALTTILSFAISYETRPDPNETSITDAQGKTICALKSGSA